jgi:hypothetical protein
VVAHLSQNCPGEISKMTAKTRRSLCASFLILVIVLGTTPAFACGPFTLNAVFTFVVHPELPLENFARGEIGVVQPSYARSYLFAAYRNLNGANFSASEQADLIGLWKERMDFSSPDPDTESTKAWSEARQKVAGTGAAPGIEVYRHREKPNEYEIYVNCQKDAFDTAASTLSERLKKYGADAAPVKDWVAAQDQVFANCAAGQHIPAPPAADADALLRADRAYQIAAAQFYSGSFADASASFAAITRDTASPWRLTAPYLAARVLVREASLGLAEKKSEVLAQAEEKLNQILNNRDLAAIHPACKRLLNLVRVRLHPEQKLHELSQTLVQNNNETLKQDLWDYTVLLDQYAGDEDSTLGKNLPAQLRKDDLTDWIVSIQSTGDSELAHAVDRWKETGSPAWLIAALTKIHSSDPQAAALVAAAEKVNVTSPAFASVAFHQIRIAIDAGKVEQARAKLDEVLARSKNGLPASARNLFLGLRMQLATSLGDFLTFAQRTPAGFSWDEDGRELPADLSEESEYKSLAGRTLFDLDAARTLNERFPLSLLQQAAAGKALPEHLQRDLVQATWLRAVLLDQPNTARELTPALKTLVPALKPLLDDYLTAQGPEASKFAALYAWLKTPGLQPIVNAGPGRRAALIEQDEYRDNWWCSAAEGPNSDNENKDQGEDEPRKTQSIAVNSKSEIRAPSFLSEAQKTTARTEHAKLVALGPGPNYLCREVVQWTERHPTDPRAAEALHLAVKSTRYGCTNKDTAKWSKAAFDVLHKRFPNSPWAKKTPYWFKD